MDSENKKDTMSEEFKRGYQLALSYKDSGIATMDYPDPENDFQEGWNAGRHARWQQERGT